VGVAQMTRTYDEGTPKMSQRESVVSYTSLVAFLRPILRLPFKASVRFGSHKTEKKGTNIVLRHHHFNQAIEESLGAERRSLLRVVLIPESMLVAEQMSPHPRT
jgi:hypothetical protein